MSVAWTRGQRQVIDYRGGNLLVSAAAGSGKTAVLVERIVEMITEKNHPVDIDHLLIMTFTNAAAAEMRERIRDAIDKGGKKTRRTNIWSFSPFWFPGPRLPPLTVSVWD